MASTRCNKSARILGLFLHCVLASALLNFRLEDPSKTQIDEEGSRMPFNSDQTEIKYPEDELEPPPPRPDQFVYMTTDEYLGEPSIGKFSILPLSESAPVPPDQPERRGLLGRLMVWMALSPRERHEKRLENEGRQHISLEKQQRQSLFSTMVPALRSLGVRRAYCRYDGGNDEGFSWLGSLCNSGRR